MSRNLKEAYDEAVEKARCTEGEVIIGDLVDFDSAKIRDSSLDFLMREGHLKIRSAKSAVHSSFAFQFTNVIFKALEDASEKNQQYRFDAGNNIGFKDVPCLYGGLSKNMKHFDGVIWVADPKYPRRHPFLGIEVAFRHETEQELLEEGLNALSKFTDVSLCLLVELIESGTPKRTTLIRIVLLERISELASTSGLMGTATNADCRPRLENFQENFKEEALGVQVRVVSDDLLTVEEIDAPEFEYTIGIPVRAIVEHSGITGILDGEFVKVSLTDALQNKLRMVDSLVCDGFYPYL